MIDEKKLIEILEDWKFKNEEKGYDTAKDLIQEMLYIVNEQPKTDWIPYEVKDIIDTIISHNEIVALWVKEETEDVRYDKRIWRGMAWEIPKQYMDCKFEKIFGTVPESIVEADTVNIRIETPQPYKKEGAE